MAHSLQFPARVLQRIDVHHSADHRRAPDQRLQVGISGRRQRWQQPSGD